MSEPSGITRILSVLYGFAAIFFILLFAMHPLLLAQEYSAGAVGTVRASRLVKGGFDLDLADGATFYWIVKPLDPVSVGDRIKKDPNSFRYFRNGRQVLSRDEAMFFLFKMTPRSMYTILASLIIISFLYYKKTGMTIFLDATARGLPVPVARAALGVLPLLLIYYAILHILMGRWS